MPWTKPFVTFALASTLASTYLFANAPPPLEEGSVAASATIPVERFLQVLAAENAAVRKLYTSEIVGPGKLVGLQFDERWRDANVEAGPLPALFLREASGNLERRPEPIGLFLGSDAPIREANLFVGAQASEFTELRNGAKERHFVAEDLGVSTAMFPDFAVSEACVTCHNEHPSSPKRDWKLGDIMGATTWTYPRPFVTESEMISGVRALRESLREAYQAYVEKTQTFGNPPTIGEQWPTNGYYLPTPEVFMAKAEQSTSQQTLASLLTTH